VPGPTETKATASGRGLRPVLVCALLSGILLLGAAPAAGQSAPSDERREPKVVRDSTHSERPPPAPPGDWVDVVLFPVRVAAFPFRLVGEGVELALPPVSGALSMLAGIETWGLDVGVGSVGPRSGPGGKVHLTRLAPLHLRSELSIRGSHRHSAWLQFSRGPPTMMLGATFRRWTAPLFWGTGPDARPEDATDYRWDQWDASFESRLLDGGVVRLGAEAGWELNRTAGGSDDSRPDITSRYGSEDLYGLGVETRFVRAGASLTLDAARRIGFQRRGATLSVAGTLYRGISDTEGDFHRIEVRGGAYLPFNPFQMVALRGRLDFTRADAGPDVPFTHLASLGDEVGSRAYPDGRFRGNDLAAATAEYRWELWRETPEESRLEAYVFYERGAVARELSRVASGDWFPSYGVGVRFLDGTAPRIEGYLADGDEGVRAQLLASVQP